MQLSDSTQVLILVPTSLDIFTEESILKKQTTHYLVTY